MEIALYSSGMVVSCLHYDELERNDMGHIGYWYTSHTSIRVRLTLGVGFLACTLKTSFTIESHNPAATNKDAAMLDADTVRTTVF